MIRKQLFVVAVLAGCVLAAAGSLLASNMAFKLNLALTGPAATGGAGSGKQLIALPYLRQGGVNDAFQLMLDIGGGTIAPIAYVGRYNKATDTMTLYTGRMGAGAPFPLTAGDGYIVQMNSNRNYLIVGAHNPTVAIPLTGPAGGGGAGTGKQIISPPYNATAVNAHQLMLDIGGGVINPVASVGRYNKSNDTLTLYTGRRGPLSFTLNRGEGYIVQMNSNVPYIPSHY